MLGLCVLVILSCFSTIHASISDHHPHLGHMGNFEEEFSNRLGANFEYVYGNIWPKPQKEIKTNEYFTLDPENFHFESVGENSDVLTKALYRYKDLTFPDSKVPADKTMKQVLRLKVKVLFGYQPMSLEMDEGYELTMDAPNCTLVANTVWGSLRGLESFSQAVHQNISGFYHVQRNRVTDWPRFKHRGFLIDTARHFINLKFILQFIDALAYSKFNVLHWHIVDDETFPFVSQEFPDLSNKGARHPTKGVYSPDDVQRVIEYARLRGIRVMPEFDSPGHTKSWGSIPDLLTPCYSGGKPNGKFGPINPTKESTYVFLEKFFGEVSRVFPDDYLHLGGDEVGFGCWKSNPDIVSWMEKAGMGKNFTLLEQYYEQRLLDIVNGFGKKYFMWQEIIDNEVKVRPDTVVNVWRWDWKKEMSRVTKRGYKTVLSSCWYLNFINYGAPYWGWDIKSYWECDPQDFVGTKEQKDNVIGGTACMWGELVDGVNLISRSWARGLAVGGRLWSSKDTTDFWAAAMQMWEHRCRYLRRGLNANSIFKSMYCRHEYQND